MKSREFFVPVYYQLAEDLKSQIESGKLKPGDMIPSESQLGATYGISRMTVRRGISLLAEAGLIEAVKGKGNFVAEPKLDQMIINFRENKIFSEDNEDQLQFKLLEVTLVGADRETAIRLGLAEGKKIFRIRRLLIGKNGPVALDVKHLPYEKGKPMLEKEIEYVEFPKMVAKHTDDMIHKIEMFISATALSPEEASLLEATPEFPALCINQTIHSKNNKPLGISKLICRSDKSILRAISYPYSGRS